MACLGGGAIAFGIFGLQWPCIKIGTRPPNPSASRTVIASDWNDCHRHTHTHVGCPCDPFPSPSPPFLSAGHEGLVGTIVINDVEECIETKEA